MGQDDERLQDEVARLRTELESRKQRELEELYEALAAARAEAADYKAQAHQNADLGRKIAATAQEQAATLRAELELLRRTSLQRGKDGRPS